MIGHFKLLNRIEFYKDLMNKFSVRVSSLTGLFEARNVVTTYLKNISKTIFKKASLVITPNAVKESKLYSIVPSNGNGDMTVVRATTATRVNSEGFIEETPYNLLTYSQDFSNANWTKLRSSIIQNTTISPNGTLTASSLIEGNTNNTQLLIQTVNLSLTIPYVFSCYLKQNTRRYAFLGFIDGSVNMTIFDLQLGTVATQGVNIISATILSVGGGWYKCSITTLPTNIATILRIAPSNSPITNIYQGDGTSGIYIWGAQLVQGSLPKDYFYTTDRLNVPRLNYDTVGGCPSILLEPQRTNLLTYSNDFSNAVWVKMNSIVLTPNVSISPDGTINASRITANIAFNQRLDYPITILANTTYTFSVYAKKGTQNQGNFRLAASSTIETFLDFTLTDNFVKYSITIPNTNLNTSIIVRIYPSNPINGSPFLAGDNAIIYGAQLEQGAYPTSYIPTVASTVTRNADVIEGQVNSNNFNSLEGVLFAETSALSNDQTNRVISVSDGTAANRILLRYDTISNEIAATVILNNINVVNLTYSTDITKYIKIAFRYKALDFGLFINGVKISSSSYANIFNNNTLNILKLTESPSGSIFNGKIKGLQVYKTALTNNECISLTTL